MRETAHRHEIESDQKYLQTTIGDLRKWYGSDFAKGCADNEKITDAFAKAAMAQAGNPSPREKVV